MSYAVGNKGAEFSLAALPSPHREHLLNWGPAATAAALPSPSSLTRCHLSQSERPWQSAKFPGLILYALLPQGEPSGVTLRLSAFAKGSPFGGAGRR